MIRTGEGRAPDVDTQFAANYDGAVAAGLKVVCIMCAACGLRKKPWKKQSLSGDS